MDFMKFITANLYSICLSNFTKKVNYGYQSK